MEFPAVIVTALLDDQNMQEALELTSEAKKKTFAHTGIASLAYNTIYKIIICKRQCLL